MVAKLLFFVTEDWYFCSHRLPLAVAAKQVGYDVSVITRVRNHGDVIESAGIRVIPFENSRRSLNPFSELLVVLRLVKIYKQEKPDIVHNVAVKPVVYGAIAARIARVSNVVHALAGLGWLSSSRGKLAGLLKVLARFFLRKLLSKGRIIVQNLDDQVWLFRLGIKVSRISLIRGSGVDIKHFIPPAESPGEPVVIVLVSRMLWDKGIGEFVEAAKVFRKLGEKAKFVLVGGPDDANPSSISEAQLKAWDQEGCIEWLGQRSDVADILAGSHIACLPSFYGEGVPKSLLEALAIGLPIVTTDSPGCREVVVQKENGLLVPPRDVEKLLDAILYLVHNPLERQRMGKASRQLVEEEFSLDKVISETLNLYQEMI